MTVNTDPSTDFFSDQYHVGNDNTPLHRYVKILIKPDSVPSSLRDKIIIADCKKSGKLISYGGKWDGEYFGASIGNFGTFAITIDTIPPTIIPTKKSSDYSQSSSIAFKIDDNIAVSGEAKGLSYNAVINGNWALFKYDLKTKTIRHYFEGKPESKDHQVILEVIDDKGNKSIFDKKFNR
jgi:hypothetical protein